MDTHISGSAVMPLDPRPVIIDIDFPENQYVKEESLKVGWCLHHSAGRDDAVLMFRSWAGDDRGRVATAYGIINNGNIFRGFDGQKYWGYALGIANRINNIPRQYKNATHDRFLNSRYVQVEICNWGGLTEKEGRLYSYTGVEVPLCQAIRYEKPFRGFNWFERYTDEEIEALRALILWHYHEFGLPKTYHPHMWDIAEEALQGAPGIWTHVSFRTDKSDCHPQPELIQMLSGL